MSPSQHELLKHILDECNFIVESSYNKSQDAITDDAVLSRAIIRSLEIIGEAVKRIDPDFKIKYSYIQWKEMAGMRDKLIHHYFGVDYDIVFNTIKNDIPELQHQLLLILEDGSPNCQ